MNNTPALTQCARNAIILRVDTLLCKSEYANISYTVVTENFPGVYQTSVLGHLPNLNYITVLSQVKTTTYF